MDEKIKEFINNWIESGELLEEHIDFFVPNKKFFSYEDVMEVINKINKHCTVEGLKDMDILCYIECGCSKHIQQWKNDFWRLVDYSDTPPSIIFGKKILWIKSDYQEIIRRDNFGYQEEYINIYTSDFYQDAYVRRLHILNKRMIEENE